MKVILVSTIVFQDYIIYNIEQLLLLNYEVVVITEKQYFDKLKTFDNKIILKDSNELNIDFDSNTKLNKNFRGGFVNNCSRRLFLVFEYIKQNNIVNCIHLENDVLLYKKITEKDILNIDNIHLVIDSENRCIPGILLIPSYKTLEGIINNYIFDKDDMCNLAIYYNNNKEKCITLPIINNCKKYPNEILYNDYYEKYKSIFDGAAIGQYLGGVDPRNIKGDTRGFINETCFIKYNNFNYQLTKNGKYYYPNIIIDNKLIPVNNLHIHSKNLKNFMITNFNENKYIDKKIDIITGEKIQFKCDHFIGFERDFKYNPNVLEKYREKLIYLDKTNRIEINNQINNDKYIFCYTHLLKNINVLISKLKKMKNEFVLVFHNSDNSFNKEHLILFEQLPLLKLIYSQNLNIDNNYEISNKIKNNIIPLPIGIANSQWKHGDLNIFNKIYNENIKKSENIYFHFKIDTNKNIRMNTYNILENKGLEWNENKQYEDYLRELKKHRYAICPEGNGMDTHRFWECLYMDVIPICIKNNITEYYSIYFPIILLDKWEDFDIEKINKNYENLDDINHIYLDIKGCLIF